MAFPALPTLFGAKSAWIMMVLKAIAAAGFMLSANLIILYAC